MIVIDIKKKEWKHQNENEEEKNFFENFLKF